MQNRRPWNFLESTVNEEKQDIKIILCKTGKATKKKIRAEMKIET